MEDKRIRKSLIELTDEEVRDLWFGVKTHHTLESPMVDAAAGYLMYRIFKPTLKKCITHVLPVVVASYLGISGFVYGHNWIVENTEVGKQIGKFEQKVIQSDYYKGFSEACEAMQAMRE